MKRKTESVCVYGKQQKSTFKADSPTVYEDYRINPSFFMAHIGFVGTFSFGLRA
jgi:hypothetical protein